MEDRYGRIKMGSTSVNGVVKGLGGSIVKIIEDPVQSTTLKATRVRILHSTNTTVPKNSRILIMSDSIEPIDIAIGRMLDD